MSIFRISGKKPLHGSVPISGRKNAALKLIAASLLSEQDVTLHRVPDIGDVRVMFAILQAMGGTVTPLGDDSYRLNTSGVTNPVIPDDLAQKLRASLVLVGPLLARFKRAVFPHPGGCVIGKRSIEPHLDAFRHLGADVSFDGHTYTLTGDNMRPNRIYLKEKSVTGTENTIMAACRLDGSTVIYNAAEEQHIRNLCDLLRGMGFAISGDGTSQITVQGSSQITPQPAECTLLPDEIETGTYAVASVITGGSVTLERVGKWENVMPILAKLDDFNVRYTYNEDAETLQILESPDLKATTIQTNPWPGFPPDLQSPFTVLATQAHGTTLVHDWMYEGRLYFVDLLEKMGANIIISDPHRVIVNGPTPLVATSSITPDLRAGAALILAALAAEGESVIEHIDLIDRGYVRIDERLRSLGADITRE